VRSNECLLFLRLELGMLARTDALALARDLPHARRQIVARQIGPCLNDGRGEDPSAAQIAAIAWALSVRKWRRSNALPQ
jgi:hypothetical protein